MKYSFIAFWESFNKNNFLTPYLKNYEYTDDCKDADILIVGSFVRSVEQYNFIKSLPSKKILYVSEPIEYFFKGTYKLWKEGVFCITFGCINKEINRFKLPLYMNYFDYKNKENFVQKPASFKKDCCLINRHDSGRTRTGIYSLLKDVMYIECPSKLFNNVSNEELNRIGNVEYIKQFKFNICAENNVSSFPGYITEKLMLCCLGGAIPIYLGYFDEIDEKIFNKNRILFYNKNNILEVRDKIVNLLKNPEEFNAFYNQPPFCETAYDTLLSLENEFQYAIDRLNP